MSEITNKFIEVFDRDALKHIIDHKKFYRGVINNDNDDADEAFNLCEKYLNSGLGCFGNMVQVEYSRKHGRGRRYAVGGTSLQFIQKQIRGTIAKDYYYDVDIENCHPVIIETLFDKKNIKLPFLSTYIHNRNDVIGDILSLNNNYTKSDIKNGILSMMYGGTSFIDNLENKTSWLVGYFSEVTMILNKTKELFPEEWEQQCILKGKDYYNIKGSTLSISIQIIEDKILETMLEYFATKKIVAHNAVLCFDGIMIKKQDKVNNGLINKHLLKIEKVIEKEHGYKVNLKVKQFKTLPKVPDELLNVCWDTTNDAKDAYKNSDYYWYDFMKGMSKTHSSYKAMYDYFKQNISRVMLRVYELEGCLIKKINPKNMFNFEHKSMRDVIQYWTLKEKENSKILATIPFKKLLDDHGFIMDIPVYNNLTFYPVGPEQNEYVEDEREFNTWTGLQAKLQEPREPSSELQLILDHIRDVWACGNLDHYDYILSWFKLIFTNPSLKSKVAIVLKSSDKQIGKGIIINNFLIPLVFGEKYSMSIIGLKDITARFNETLMNKILINCDELSTTDGGYHSSFDTLKTVITDTKIVIELKGGKKFSYPNYTNFIMCTNHDFTLNIEIGDCRYAMFECSPIHKGDFAYFKKLMDSFNQDVANEFFTYVHNYNNKTDDVRNIPMTQLKENMIIGSFTSPLRFLYEIQTGLYSVPTESGFINGSSFYRCYKDWCNESNEKIMSNTLFGKEVRKYVVKKKTGGKIKYELGSININL